MAHGPSPNNDSPNGNKTYVNENYSPLLSNFALHMHTVLPSVQYVVFAFDAKTYDERNEIAASLHGKTFPWPGQMLCKARFIDAHLNEMTIKKPKTHCTDIGCVSLEHYKDPAFQYKTQLVTALLREAAVHPTPVRATSCDAHRWPQLHTPPTIINLDITTYVRSEQCFSDMVHHAEDIVSSGSSGTPKWFADKHGVVLNTGLQLLRAKSLPLFVEFEKKHLSKGGMQQPVLAQILDAHGFQWVDKAKRVAAVNFSVSGAITIHVLNESAWNRYGKASLKSPKTSDGVGGCVFHPFDERHENQEKLVVVNRTQQEVERQKIMIEVRQNEATAALKVEEGKVRGRLRGEADEEESECE